MPRKILNEELNRLSIEEFKVAKKFPITVVLDNIRSRNNVGSIFRTCDAFKVEQIILGGITPTPPHRDIYKTALGATNSVDWKHVEKVEDCVLELKQQGYKCLAIEQVEEAIQLQNVAKIEMHKVALIFGSEVGGVDQKVVDLCDNAIEIPQFGTKHSLNVSVSLGLTLWEIVSIFLRENS